jgi:hypothetical protein
LRLPAGDGRRKVPDAGPPAETGRGLRSLFAKVTKSLGGKIEVAKSELEAIKVAMDMEIEFYSLHDSRSEESSLPVGKRLYAVLAGEKREHHLDLFDSYDYLGGREGSLAQEGHWSLDGV